MNLDEMSIDELIDYDDKLGWPSSEVHIIKRCAARDAILDMAEALDAEGLVVVPREATLNMWDVGDEAVGSMHRDSDAVYRAMIEAAPLMGVE